MQLECIDKKVIIEITSKKENFYNRVIKMHTFCIVRFSNYNMRFKAFIKFKRVKINSIVSISL